jgi:hypothetical protein
MVKFREEEEPYLAAAGSSQILVRHEQFFLSLQIAIRKYHGHLQSHQEGDLQQ